MPAVGAIGFGNFAPIPAEPIADEFLPGAELTNAVVVDHWREHPYEVAGIPNNPKLFHKAGHGVRARIVAPDQLDQAIGREVREPSVERR